MHWTRVFAPFYPNSLNSTLFVILYLFELKKKAVFLLVPDLSVFFSKCAKSQFAMRITCFFREKLRNSLNRNNIRAFRAVVAFHTSAAAVWRTNSPHFPTMSTATVKWFTKRLLGSRHHKQSAFASFTYQFDCSALAKNHPLSFYSVKSKHLKQNVEGSSTRVEEVNIAHLFFLVKILNEIKQVGDFLKFWGYVPLCTETSKAPG